MCDVQIYLFSFRLIAIHETWNIYLLVIDNAFNYLKNLSSKKKTSIMHLHMHTKLTMQQNWTLIDKWKWYLVKYSFSETDPQYTFLLIFQKIIYLLCLSNRKLYICEIKFVKNRSFPQLNFCWFFFFICFSYFLLVFSLLLFNVLYSFDCDVLCFLVDILRIEKRKNWMWEKLVFLLFSI